MRFGVLAVVSILLLVGCEVSVSVRPAVTVGGFKTDYSHDGRSVVCDNRTTTFTYVLSYPSSLRSFDVFLEGGSSERERYIHSVRLDARERERGKYERSFSVREQIAPLSESTVEMGGGVRTQEPRSDAHTIVVNPREPKIVGYTILRMDIRDLGGRELRSDPIPVLDWCR